MLRSDVPVRDAATGVVALVAEPSDQVAASLPYPILLTVVDPVRADELAELDEGLGRERIVRTKVLGLADETKQQLSIPSGDRDHGSSKNMTDDQWTPVFGGAILVSEGFRPARRARFTSERG